MMDVQKCARFSENPKLSHEKEIKRIYKCHVWKKHIGIEAKTNSSLGLINQADSDFANGWKKIQSDNIENLFSTV